MSKKRKTYGEDWDLDTAMDYIEHLESHLLEEDIYDLTECPKCESIEWSRMFYDNVKGKLLPVGCSDCPPMYDHH